MTQKHLRIFTNYDGWCHSRRYPDRQFTFFRGEKVDLNDEKDSEWIVDQLIKEGFIRVHEPMRVFECGAYAGASYLFKKAPHLFMNYKADGSLNPMQKTALFLNLKHHTTLLKG